MIWIASWMTIKNKEIIINNNDPRITVCVRFGAAVILGSESLGAVLGNLDKVMLRRFVGDVMRSNVGDTHGFVVVEEDVMGELISCQSGSYEWCCF